MKILFAPIERLYLHDFLGRLHKQFSAEMLRQDRRDLKKLSTLFVKHPASTIPLKPKQRTMLLEYCAAGIETMAALPEPTEQTKYSQEVLQKIVERIYQYENRTVHTRQ